MSDIIRKKRRIWRKILFSITAFFVLLICIVLFIGKSGFSFATSKTTENDYSGIMGATITSNPLVTDIAMLGAHDAFSHRITTKSAVDPAEGSGGILNNGAAKALANGMFVRLSKAQKSDAYQLLKRGVRYLDVRLSNVGGVWYTKHGLLSDKLEFYLEGTLRFLYENPTEFIIFDMQHVYLGDAEFSDLFNYLKTFTHNNKSLLDYVTYNPFTVPLDSLRYNDVKGGVVILAKTDRFEGCYHYNYNDSIRSVWHEKNKQDAMLDAINAEYTALKDNPDLDRNKLRVNQAQMTGIYSGDKIMSTIFGWSLLDMAALLNDRLVKHENFSDWLKVMPIFMVDNSDSMKSNFNDVVMEKIGRFNEELA